jgi:CubicO group peptidase (beta-lactamase class C family)
MNGAWRQLRVLHREFLFRVVDRELLSTHAQGDMSKLLLQFAALLIFISLVFVSMAQSLENVPTPQVRILLGWMNVHRLIAATMLVVGLFAVLSWQSMFPDRQDVHVLGPLPVRPRTMLLAKVAAVITALLTTVLALHLAAGIAWPVVLNLPAEVQTIPALTSDRPLPAVDAAGLKPVMDRDLAEALRSGVLAPGAGGGIAIGVYTRGERRVFTYGAATPESLFEAGSVTKTFTGTLLAHLVGNGLTTLDEPVRQLIPDAGVEHRPGGDSEITLLDLATHRSSLRIDGTFKPEDPENPFADYTKERLYIYLRYRGLRKYANFGFIYSNLGFGLLGHALATRAGTGFIPLVREVITDPLGMHDTPFTMTREERQRFMQPYRVNTGPRRPVKAFDTDVLAGAGGFRTTVGDMLTWAEANLHPERLASRGEAGAALAAAIVAAHEPHATVGQRGRMGLAWFIDPATGRYFHGGATPGTTAEVSFIPREDTALVVLTNTGPGSAFSAEILGEHIRARLAGTTPIALADLTIPAAGSVPRLLRFAAAWWLTMIAAGAFIFCLVMSIQGVALQLLPRRLFLRASSFLQIGAFAIIVSVYCLQPGATGLGLIAAQQPLSAMTGLVPWSPTFWFLGLFQQLSGSPAFPMMAGRARIALGIVLVLTTTVYALSYFRTLRRIAEEATIVPSTRAARGARWLPSFVGFGGGGLSAAVVPFSVRTLLRSPQHRVILAFYLGMGFAAAIFFMNLSAPAPIVDQNAGPLATSSADRPWHEESGWLLASSILMLAFSVVGTRLAFALPLDLRANWIFRIMPTREGREYLAARRRAMLAVGVLPVWAAFAVLLLSAWPWLPAIGHLIVLGLLGAILTEMGLRGVQKIPFTCSYLPGKSAFHVTFWVFFLIGVPIALKASSLEQEALQDPVGFGVMLAGFTIILIALRWWNWRAANSGETEPMFEEEMPGQLVSLNVWDSQIPTRDRPDEKRGGHLTTPSPSIESIEASSGGNSTV